MVKKKINKYHLLQIDQIKRSFVNFSDNNNKIVLKIFKSSLGVLIIIRDFFLIVILVTYVKTIILQKNRLYFVIYSLNCF